MVMNTRQKLDMLAPIAVVERVVNDEHLGGLGRCQGQNLLVENGNAEQVQELAPVGIDRIEEAINGVLADYNAGGIGLQIAEEILAGKNQAEYHPHHHNGGDAALFNHVALFQ